MKKMTNKEFKAILAEAGVPIDVFGYEGILVKVALQLRAQARKDRKAGYGSLAKSAEERASKIHELLKKRGYFD